MTTSKRLLAVVRPLNDGGTSWAWDVEFVEGPAHSVESCTTSLAIRAMQECERVALARGFGLRWCGLVGEGVDLDKKPDAAAQQPTGTDGAA